MSLPNRGGQRRVGAMVEVLESRRLLSAAVGQAHPHTAAMPAGAGSSADGFTPAQIRHAYGFDQVGGDGSGQTIAIIDAFRDPSIISDLATFDAKYSLPAPPSLQIVGQTGGALGFLRTDSGWASETALDVEWAHAIAPQANILLVETRSDSFPDLMAGVNMARTIPGISVISMSWGGPEFRGQLRYDAAFNTPAGHQGITFVAAAGDDGTRHGPEWPGTSPHVISVGGTSLYATPGDGTYANEIAWGADTGGVSKLEGKPAYQAGVQPGARRSSPDVSYNADPNTGYSIYSSVKDGGYVGWQTLAGTSGGTPQWAAQVAIANQLRAAGGQNTLDGGAGALPALYSVYGAPGSAGYDNYANCMHDVTQGRSGRVVATAGYDYLTGLGSPKAASVISALVNAASPAVRVAPKVTPSVVKGTAKHAVGRPAARGASGGAENNGSVSANVVVPPAMRDAQSGSDALGSAQGVANAAISGAGKGLTSSTEIESRFNPSASTFVNVTMLPQAVLTSMLQSADVAAPVVAGAFSEAAHVAGVSAQAAVSILPMALDLGRQDAMASFADAMASFAHESTALGTAVGGTHVRAWAVTFAVVGVDVALIGYWRATRKSKRHAQGKLNHATFCLDPL